MDQLGSLTSIDANKWVDDLDNIDINEIHESRHCEVVLVAEKTIYSSRKLKMIKDYSHSDSDQDLYFITLSDVYCFAENYRNKQIYIDEALQKIIKCACWEASRYLQAEKSIPTDLLVKILKLKMISTIKYDIYRCQKDAIHQRSPRLFQAPAATKGKEKGKRGKKGKTGKKGKKSKTTSKKSKTKSTKSSKKSKKSGKGQQTAQDTCLPYLLPASKETLPPEGTEIPNKTIYIALTEFYMPDIVAHLFSNGLKLTCVVEFYEKPGIPRRISTAKIQSSDLLSHKHYTLLGSGSKRHSTVFRFRKKHDVLHIFWCIICDMFVHKKSPLVKESFLMTYSPLVTAGSCDKDEYMTCCQQLFEHFSNALHKIRDFRRQHNNYLDKLKIYRLGDTPKITPIYCMEIYSKSLNSLPIDCINVEIILEYLLDEVCHRIERVDGISSEGSRTSSDIYRGVDRNSINERHKCGFENLRNHSDFRDQVKKIFGHHKFGNPKDVVRFPKREHEFLAENGYNLKKDARIIHERNDLERILNCYTNIHQSVFNACTNHLKKNVCVRLWEQYPVSAAEDIGGYSKEFKEWCRIVRLNLKELLACIDVFLFGKITCAVRKATTVTQTCETEKYFPTRNNLLQMVGTAPDIIGCREAICKDSQCNIYEHLNLDEFKWEEELSSAVMLQELNKVLDNFECVDHRYVPLFDSLYLRLHHNADKFGVSTNSWSTSIRTPVDLCDFLVSVIHEDADFIMKEEELYTEINNLYQEIVEKEKLRINSFQAEADDFIMRDSVKDKFLKAELEPEIKVSAKKGKKGPKKPKKGKGKVSKKESKKGSKKESKKGSKKELKKGSKKESKKGSKKGSKKSKKGASKEPTIDAYKLIEEDRFETNVKIEDVLNAVYLNNPPRYLTAYDFEGRVAVSGSSTAFYSLDPLNVVVNRVMVTGEPMKISLTIGVNDNNVILHSHTHSGFTFHINFRNGGVVAFGKEADTHSKVPVQKLREVYLLNEKRIRALNCLNRHSVLKRKLLVTSGYLKQIINALNNVEETQQMTKRSSIKFDNALQMSKVDSQTRKNSSYNTLSKTSDQALNDKSVRKLSRKQFLQELKDLKASTTLFDPHFRICSSKLHKYSYANRITSPVLLELNQITKFMNCKSSYGLKKKVKIVKCFPVPNRMNMFESFSHYDVRFTLQNGLHIRTIPGIVPDFYYINQFFFSKGPQHTNIAMEESRTFLRSGYVIVKNADGHLLLYGGNGQKVKFEIPLIKKRERADSKAFRKTQTQNALHKFVRTLKRHLKRLARHSISAHDCQYSISRRHFGCNIKKLSYDRNVTVITESDDFKLTLVTIDGKRVKFRKGKVIESDCYYVSKEDHIRSNKFEYRREDGTVIVLTKEGFLQTTYTDGTRITSSFEIDTELVNVDLTAQFGKDTTPMGAWISINMNYQYEHPNYATVACGGKNNCMKVLMPDKISLEHQDGDEYVLKIDESTTAKITTKKIFIETPYCPGCQKNCTCTVNVKPLYELKEDISDCVPLLTAKDTYDKLFIVNYDGTCRRNDDYIRREKICDHLLHKRQTLQTFLVMNRDCSGKLIWTQEMYKNRLLESQLEPNEEVILYVDQESLNVQTSEFRGFEKHEHYNRFSMSYLPTITPYYKEPPFDISAAMFVKHRLLQYIPEFKTAAPVYRLLTNQILDSDDEEIAGNVKVAQRLAYLATKLETASSIQDANPEKVQKRRKDARKIFGRKLMEWRLKCKAGAKAIVQHKIKPISYFNLDSTEEPTDSKTRVHISDQPSGETNFGRTSPKIEAGLDVKNAGTNTLIPFDLETEYQLEKMERRSSTSSLSLSSASSSSSTTEAPLDTAEATSLSLKHQLIDYISKILEQNYNTTLDEDDGSVSSSTEEMDTVEDGSKTSADRETTEAVESDEGTESSSSVPEFFKSQTYRAVRRLYINSARKRYSTAKKRETSDSTQSEIDAEREKHEDEDSKDEETYSLGEISRSLITRKVKSSVKMNWSLKVLTSKILKHAGFNNSDLMLKPTSNETDEDKLQYIRQEEERMAKLGFDDSESKSHHCRFCTDIPFINQNSAFYSSSKCFLDISGQSKNDG